MANAIYPKTKAQLLQATLNLLLLDIRLILVDLADYTYDAAHEFLSDVPSGARVATSTSLTGKGVTAATAAFTSDFKTFSAVTGDVAEALIAYVHTGTEGTSRLLWFQDTGVSGLPVTPDGRDIKVTPAAGGWFTL